MMRKPALLSRLDVEQYLIELPPMPGERVGPALKYRLPALYPGSRESARFDYVRNGGKGNRYLLFVIDEELLEARRAEAKGGALLSPTLIAAELAPRGHWTSLLWADAWASLDRFEDGVLVESSRMKRSGNVAEDWARLLPRLASGEGRDSLCVFATEESLGDAAALERAGIDGGQLRIVPLSRALARIRKSRALVFPLRPRERKARDYALVALACLDLALAGVFTQRSLGKLEAELSTVREEYLRLQRRNGEALRLSEEIAASEERYRKLEAEAAPDMYAVVAAVASKVGPGCGILSLVVEEGEFRMEAEGPDALASLSALEGSGCFSSVKLHQALPVSPGKERFSISGSSLLKVPESAGIEAGDRRQ